jgi:hypothetical protein
MVTAKPTVYVNFIGLSEAAQLSEKPSVNVYKLTEQSKINSGEGETISYPPSSPPPPSSRNILEYFSDISTQRYSGKKRRLLCFQCTWMGGGFCSLNYQMLADQFTPP